MTLYKKNHTSQESNPASAQSSPKALFCSYSLVHGLGMQAVLYELEMKCTKILQLHQITDLETLVKRNVMRMAD